MAATPPDQAPTEASIVERLTIVADSIAPAYAALVAAQDAIQQLLTELTKDNPEEGTKER